MIRKKFGNLITVADIILIVSLLLASLSVFLIFSLTKEKGAYARVTVDGEEVALYSLSESGEYSVNGGTNILVIENGYAYMKSAACRDKLCVNYGKISHTGERIVCLPNRVMVEIIGADDGMLEV